MARGWFRRLAIFVVAMLIVPFVTLPTPLARASTPVYSIYDLGTLGGTWSEATSINASGQVVGNSTTSGGAHDAFLWTPDTANGSTGSMIDLGKLAGGSIHATSINAFGQVVGDTTVGADQHTFLWTPNIANGTTGSMGALGIPPVRSYAYGINNFGQVVGWVLADGINGHAILWTPDTPHSPTGSRVDLGTLPGASRSAANSINASGEVVGGSDSGDVFLWTPDTTNGSTGSMNDLGNFGSTRGGTSINDSGQVVGNMEVGITNNTAIYHAFVWTPDAPNGSTGSMVDLRTLGGLNSFAAGVNASGGVVGESDTSSGDQHAFLWMPNSANDSTGSMIDLGTLPGGTSSSASGINDNGQIVGSAVVDGVSHAVMWMPTSANPPEISAVAPTSGPTTGGTSVTITGSGFTGAIAVSFGGTPATSPHVASDTQITATSPAHAAGPVDVTVTTPAGTSATNNTDQFIYVRTKIGYFALGDSIASGHGLMDDSDGATGGCHRSTTASYPALVEQLLSTDFDIQPLDLLACSGASFSPTSQAMNTCVNQAPVGYDTSACDYLDINSQVSRLVYELSHQPKDQQNLVSITAGIDDLPWTDLVSVVRLISESDQAFNTEIQTDTASIQQNMAASLNSILSADSNVSVVVSGYHDPYNPQSWVFDLANTLLPGDFAHGVQLNPQFVNLLISFRLTMAGYFLNHQFGIQPSQNAICSPSNIDCYQRTVTAITMLNSALQSAVSTEAKNYPGRVAFVSVFDKFQQHVSPTTQCGSSPDAPGGSGANAPDLSATWIQYPGEKGINSPQPLQLKIALGRLAATRYGDCFHPNTQGAEYYATTVEQSAHELLSNIAPPGYVSLPSYAGDCGSRPDGTICIGFDDGYTWLVNDAQSIDSWSNGGTWDGHAIQVAIGVSSVGGLEVTYSHILGTNFVKEENAP